MSGLHMILFLWHRGEGRTVHAGGCIGLHGITGDMRDNLDVRGLPKTMRAQLP